MAVGVAVMFAFAIIQDFEIGFVVAGIAKWGSFVFGLNGFGSEWSLEGVGLFWRFFETRVERVRLVPNGINFESAGLGSEDEWGKGFLKMEWEFGDADAEDDLSLAF